MAITDEPELAERMRLFADKASPRGAGRRHAFLGVNYRMNNLTAAAPPPQVRKLRAGVSRRRDLAHRLVEQVGDLAGVRVPGDVAGHAIWVFPLVLPGGRNAWWADALAAEGSRPTPAGCSYPPTRFRRCASGRDPQGAHVLDGLTQSADPYWWR